MTVKSTGFVGRKHQSAGDEMKGEDQAFTRFQSNGKGIGPSLGSGFTLLVMLVGFLFLLGCGQRDDSQMPSRGPTVADTEQPTKTAEVTKPPGGETAKVQPVEDPGELIELLGLFNRGTALLEQYRYGEAAEILKGVLSKRPDWIAAKFNLALAYLNMHETKGAEDFLGEARKLFEEILEVQPNHLHAWFSLGLLWEHLGENEKALLCFQKVYEADPQEPAVMYKYAEALLSVGREQEGTELLEKLVDAHPGFVSGVYRLAMQYQRTRQGEKAKPLFARFKQLNAQELAGGTFTVRKVYGSAGKYYLALGIDNLPRVRDLLGEQAVPAFSPEVTGVGEPLTSWKVGDVEVLVPPVAVGDWNKDGFLDLCIANEHGQIWVFWNEGDGKFLPKLVAEWPTTQILVGDIDNDGNPDLWVAGKGLGKLLMGDGQGAFEEISLPALPEGKEDAVVLAARLVDYDLDGDLDLLAFIGSSGAIPARSEDPAAEAVLLVNSRDGTFGLVTELRELEGVRFPPGGVLIEDFDGDRDWDLITFAASDISPVVCVNERVGEFRIRDGRSLGLEITEARAATCGDVDKDGQPDILVFTPKGCVLLLNRGYWRFERAPSDRYPFQSLVATGGQWVDVDNDGDLDLLLADVSAEGATRSRLFINLWPEQRFVGLEELVPGNVLEVLKWEGAASTVAADLDNNGAIDLVFVPMGGLLTIVWGMETGRNWLQIELQGTQGQDQKTRSNSSALGARVEVKAGPISQQYLLGVPTGPAASAPLRIHAGLGTQTRVDWLRVTWPDAVLQAELEIPANQLLPLTELQRKVSSCPHLFAWTGTHFQFVSDFGGKGGLGYWVAPGKYAEPQPLELVPLPPLVPLDGRYVLKILEPLEEVVYLDELKLLIVEHPLDTTVLPSEMMAVGVSPPLEELLLFRQEILPARARDHLGRDITPVLSAVDRVCVGATDADPHFTGFARDHFIEVEFDLEKASWEQNERLFLIAYGWVNYAYSSTNFAAHQAGLRLRAPTISVFRGGQWVPLLKEVGYPAGINHVMTVELTGLVQPGDRRFRLETNMDLSWDKIALGIVDPAAGERCRVVELSPSRSVLSFYGFPREYSPDGQRPNLYDYTNVDTNIPWKRPRGYYTVFGEVTPLISARDDAFVIMGPGEELTVEFDVPEGAPSAGFTRTFILKTFSYCKDMDWHTAHGQTVEPLPFRGMGCYADLLIGTGKAGGGDSELHRLFNRRYHANY